MAQHLQAALLRRKQVEAETGYSRSTIYNRIAQGLFPKPVHIGSRAVAFVSQEVQAINAARIAGQSDEELRALVLRLQSARPALASA